MLFLTSPPTSQSDLLDQSLALETSTGVEIKIRTAGIVCRGYARLIDEIIKFLIVGVLFFLVMPFGGIGFGIAALGSFFVSWFYGVIFELYNQGATPGKKIMGLRVVTVNGTPIDFAAAALRNILLFADSLPIGYLVGIVTIALTSSQQRIGDLVADTLVIYTDQTQESKRQAKTQYSQFPEQLTTEEKQLFLSYQERVNQFTIERRIELAELLSPIVKRRGQPAVDQLLRTAEGIRSGT